MENRKEKIRQVKTAKSTLKSVRIFIKLLSELKKTFTVSYTSYTATINISGQKRKYLFTDDGKKQDFTLLNKLKFEINKSNLHVDGVRTHNIKYFSLTNLKPCFHKKVYNIDITDCYPTTLKNLGFISEAFYNELKAVEKIKKLKTLGQIATRKTIYEYQNGEVKKIYQKSNEYLRNVWFCICHETGEAINECKINTDSFLFFWFDGIYFRNKKDAEKIKKILTARKYKFKEEVLNDFTVTKNSENIYINYLKDGKQKKFVLPLEKTP